MRGIRVNGKADAVHRTAKPLGNKVVRTIDDPLVLDGLSNHIKN